MTRHHEQARRDLLTDLSEGQLAGLAHLVSCPECREQVASRLPLEADGTQEIPLRSECALLFETKPILVEAAAQTEKGMWRNLGQALSLVREVRRRSQASVAREAGIGKSQLSKYENGRELPKLESLEKVLNALDVGPFEFFYTLHIVDSRADDLTGGTAAAREAGLSAAGLPPLRGNSLLSPDAEQSFANLLLELLKLYRSWVEQTLHQPGRPAHQPRRRSRSLQEEPADGA